MSVNLTLRVSEQLLRQAKACAALRGETLSAIVRESLAEYVVQCQTEANGNEDADWARLGIRQFLAGYADSDSIYDTL